MLLILPGFVTSVVGLLLLLPPVRNIAHRMLRRRFSVRVANRVVKVVNTRGSAAARRADPTPSTCCRPRRGSCPRRVTATGLTPPDRTIAQYGPSQQESRHPQAGQR